MEKCEKLCRSKNIESVKQKHNPEFVKKYKMHRLLALEIARSYGVGTLDAEGVVHDTALESTKNSPTDLFFETVKEAKEAYEHSKEI
jgi:hypothetical protein